MLLLIIDGYTRLFFCLVSPIKVKQEPAKMIQIPTIVFLVITSFKIKSASSGAKPGLMKKTNAAIETLLASIARK